MRLECHKSRSFCPRSSADRALVGRLLLLVSYEEWKALVDRGLSIRGISKETGLSYTTVRYWLRKHDLKTLGPSRHSSWDNEKFKAACSESSSIRELLARMGAGDTANEYRYARKLADELDVIPTGMEWRLAPVCAETE